MDFNELRRLNETIRAVKLAQQVKQIQELQKLNAILKQMKDAQGRQDAIKKFCEEKKDEFWRGEKPSEQELEILREKTGYDQKLWAEIVRELLGEPPPRN